MINVYPKYIKAKYWAATVCNDYSDYGLPILLNEDNWADWAETVVGFEPFANAGVPSPYNQKKLVNKDNKKDEKVLQYTFESWAKIAYHIMNSQD